MSFFISLILLAPNPTVANKKLIITNVLDLIFSFKEVSLECSYAAYAACLSAVF